MWTHFEPMFKRTVTAIDSTSEKHQCTISIGRVTTGKQKVFKEYYCEIQCNGLGIIDGSFSLYLAFLSVARTFIAKGYSINIYGLQSDYRESGLSENSGLGYVSSISSTPFLMIDELPNQFPVSQ